MFGDYFRGKKLITFDLDGTVVKSEHVWDIAFRKVMRVKGWEWNGVGQYGASVWERWERIIKENKIERAGSIQDLVDLTHNEFVINMDSLELTDGFWELVAELKLDLKLKLALVTNTAKVVTDKVVGKMEFSEVFDFVICGDEVKNPKPAPDIYISTLNHFKVSSKDALAFEDSLVGSTSSTKAGIKTLLVWDKMTSMKRFPDNVVAYLEDFTSVVGNTKTTPYEDILKNIEEKKEKPKE